MSRPLIIDNELRNKVEKEGVITFPLLDEAELAELRQLHLEMHPMGAAPFYIDGLHMTTWSGDSTYKQEVAHKLRSFFSDKIQRVFQGFRSLNYVFIIKKRGEDSPFPVHQDWSVVDESLFPSFNVWIPLQDVDERNGALWILKGSQAIDRPIRGAGCLFPNYKDVIPQFQHKVSPIPVKAGTAVIFYHKVIHGSPPNLGAEPRTTICFTVIPKEATLQIYFQEGPQSPLQVHHPEDDFMYHYTHLRTESEKRPPSPRASWLEAPYQTRTVSREEIEALI